MKKQLMMALMLIGLSISCKKDQTAQPGPEQITQKLSHDDDYQQLNNNAIRLATLAKKHEKVFKENAAQLMAMKTDNEVEAFLNKNGMAEVVKIARDNQKISVALKERYPRINEVDRVDLAKTAEISIKDKMEMGGYNPDGSYDYDGMTDQYIDPTLDATQKCWLEYRSDEDRCVRNFTIEVVFNVVAIAINVPAGVLSVVHNVATMSACKYDADKAYTDCMEDARAAPPRNN